MSISKYCLAAIGLMSVSACSIVQKVEPVTTLPSSEVCLIENPAVRDTFAPALRSAMANKDVMSRIIDANSAFNACPTTMTYTARWSWDLTIYMSYAELIVYQDSKRVASALYDSRKGGSRLDKFGNAEGRIVELVDLLFPANVVRAGSDGDLNRQPPQFSRTPTNVAD